MVVIASACVVHGTCQVRYLPFHLVVPRTLKEARAGAAPIFQVR